MSQFDQLQKSCDKSPSFSTKDLVDLNDLVKSGRPLKIDLKYASTDNEWKKNLYCGSGIKSALIHKSCLSKLADALERAEKLIPGYEIVVWDAFRPNSVQKTMYDETKNKLCKNKSAQDCEIEVTKLVGKPATPENPQQKSMHIRGLAVDVTLQPSSKVNSKNSLPKNAKGTLEMGTRFDEPSVCIRVDQEKNFSTNLKKKCGHITEEVLKNRRILREIMEGRGRKGFQSVKYEWWHFNCLDPETNSLKDFPYR